MARVLAVLMLAAISLIGVGTGVAAASGFDCKEVPSPEFPNETVETNFDSSSANRSPRDGGGGTGYESYGWAGLKWHTYDLGCGEDLVKAPGAVGDTTLGNTFLTIGKSLAAAAFWLDDQTKTGRDATEAGVTPALAQFDRIVYSISDGMSGVYTQWLGIALVIVASIVLWKSMKADTAGVTKTSAIAAAGLMLGALFVGAPQKAVQVGNDTFGSLITDTQDQIFSVQFGDGPDGGTLTGGPTDPKNVLIDQVFLPDWRTGWFGANYDSADAAGLGPKLRNSLAFSYREQQQVKDNPNAQAELAEQKADKFREIVDDLEAGYQLSYYQFQGKDSGRTSTGFLGMIKLALPSMLWVGASLLKITALLAVRFSILFAPLWVPLALASGGWLARILRMLVAAYMWGVAGAVIVALYLMALVQLYVNGDGQVDGSWRLWFVILLTVVCWAIMRPFKRMSQTFTQNSSSVVNRKARDAKRSLKTKAFAAAGAALGGPGGAIAAKAGERFARRGRADDGEGKAAFIARPEGRGLHNRRQQALTQARADARRSRTERLGQGTDPVAERDARIAEIAAVTSRGLARGAIPVEGKAAERAAATGVSAWRRLDKDEAESRRQERMARKELLTASVGQRWDGGDRSAIAPMKVYTPARHREAAPASTNASASASGNNGPRQSRHATLSSERPTAAPAPRPRVWKTHAPSEPTPRDRYL